MHVSAPVVHVQLLPPGVAKTVYPVMTEPPLLGGADHVTTTCVFPRVPLTFVGASGVVIGITDAEADEALESPAALDATTVNV